MHFYTYNVYIIKKNDICFYTMYKNIYLRYIQNNIIMLINLKMCIDECLRTICYSLIEVYKLKIQYFHRFKHEKLDVVYFWYDKKSFTIYLICTCTMQLYKIELQQPFNMSFNISRETFGKL